MHCISLMLNTSRKVRNKSPIQCWFSSFKFARISIGFMSSSHQQLKGSLWLQHIHSAFMRLALAQIVAFFKNFYSERDFFLSSFSCCNSHFYCIRPGFPRRASQFLPCTSSGIIMDADAACMCRYACIVPRAPMIKCMSSCPVTTSYHYSYWLNYFLHIGKLSSRLRTTWNTERRFYI